MWTSSVHPPATALPFPFLCPYLRPPFPPARACAPHAPACAPCAPPFPPPRTRPPPPPPSPPPPPPHTPASSSAPRAPPFPPARTCAPPAPPCTCAPRAPPFPPACAPCAPPFPCNWPRASPALVSTGTGHYDVCFVLPVIIPCMISFGAAACSLTHPSSCYRCPISCSLYCIGMMCGGPCSAPNC